MEEITLSKTLKMLASLGSGFWLTVLSVVAAYVLLGRLYIKGVLFSNGENALKEAKDAGRVIIGKRISHRTRRNESDTKVRDWTYVATYEYTLNGKTGRKTLHSKQKLPTTISLYYKKDANIVFSETETGGCSIIFMYIIPILIGVLVAKLLGVDMEAISAAFMV